MTIAGAEIADLPADRLTARMLAHALIEQTQVAPRLDLIDRLAGQARAAGWGEVLVLLLHSGLIGRSLVGAPYRQVRAASDAMLEAAEASGEEILIALALASRALFVVHADHPGSVHEDVGGLLARAVAMLDDAAATEPAALGLRAVELPVAYIECGQAYHRLALWELEEEMYVRAAAALDLSLPAATRPVRHLTARVLVVNRLESATALACALLEIGERGAAGRVAAGAVRPTPAERADLPPMWECEIRALERFLDVVARHPRLAADPAEVPAALYDLLGASTWPGYRGCLLLAAAVGARDRGDVAAAAVLGERAVMLFDDYKPSLTTLALHLAALAGPDGAARRYARHLAALRWQTRLAVLGACRTRLAAAQVLRHNDQLSRQANVDALTGLANRHAELRHRDRLRRSGPGERLGVVLVDVDHFKTINDTYGHTVGDEVLREIGAVLHAAIRPSDLAVRLGGDEFMLLTDLPHGAEAPGLADDIVRTVVRHDWNAVAPGLVVSISAGQAVGAARDVDELVRTADVNLYRAKAAGRGRAVTAGVA